MLRFKKSNNYLVLVTTTKASQDGNPSYLIPMESVFSFLVFSPLRILLDPVFPDVGLLQLPETNAADLGKV